MMKKPSDERLLKYLHHKWNKRTLSIMSLICERFIFKGCFTDIDTIGLSSVKKRIKAGKHLIFIPDHQSEYDWIIIQSRLYRAGIKTVIQAGDNLFVGPLDPILRECGAFMTIRQNRKIYAKHWLNNIMFKHLGRRPLIITKEMYSRLYIKQLKNILGKERFNLLVFPGYETDPYSGKVKYGRSYSGEFNPLSPHVFIMVSKAVRELGLSNVEYIPVNVTYERVPEDILFREFKADTKKKQIAKYIYDHYYTFIKAPFSKELRQVKARACVKFGRGIPVNLKIRARELAESIRCQIGRLIRVYESMIVFHSLNSKFILSKEELKKNILKNVEKLRALGIDCSPLYKKSGEMFSLDAMLNRVKKCFNLRQSPIIPLKTYLTLEYDENEVFIHNPHLASYYGNQLTYILNRGETCRNI